jgi:serine/threonine protein kinase
MFVLQKDGKDPGSQKNKKEVNQFYWYYIMPKYTISFQDLICQENLKISPEKVLRIMVQMIDILQLVHSVGYTHNDIKSSNIMINEHCEATLIDFGFAKQFIEKDDSGEMKHVKNRKIT